jgi:hypothetical protein
VNILILVGKTAGKKQSKRDNGRNLHCEERIVLVNAC